MKFVALVTLAVLLSAGQASPAPTGATTRTATATLTSAQLRNLTSEVELVPAIPGKAIFPLWVVGFYRAGSTPYTVTDWVLSLHYAGSRTTLYGLYIDMLARPTSQQNYETTNQGQAVPQTEGVGKALVASCLQASPAEGDGTLTVTVGYVVASP